MELVDYCGLIIGDSTALTVWLYSNGMMLYRSRQCFALVATVWRSPPAAAFGADDDALTAVAVSAHGKMIAAGAGLRTGRRCCPLWQVKGRAILRLEDACEASGEPLYPDS